jgi:hypothetical protein
MPNFYPGAVNALANEIEPFVARLNPVAWDAMVARWPFSLNVEDLRTPEDIAASQRAWEAANYPPLVQFPAYEEPKRKRK